MESQWPELTLTVVLLPRAIKPRNYLVSSGLVHLTNSLYLTLTAACIQPGHCTTQHRGFGWISPAMAKSDARALLVSVRRFNSRKQFAEELQVQLHFSTNLVLPRIFPVYGRLKLNRP